MGERKDKTGNVELETRIAKRNCENAEKHSN
jgi:hypothetical protein